LWPLQVPFAVALIVVVAAIVANFLASFFYLIVGQVLLVTVLSPQVLAGTGLTLQVSMIMLVVGVVIDF